MEQQKQLGCGTEKRFFTLIELLVVIAIIAILAAILMPALQQARVRAQTANCLAKLKEISLGVSAYANDSANYKPCAIWNSSSDAYHYKILGGGDKNQEGKWLPNHITTKFWRCPAIAREGFGATYGLNAHNGMNRFFKFDMINRYTDETMPSKWSQIKNLSACWLYTCGTQFGIYRDTAGMNISTDTEPDPNGTGFSLGKTARLYAVHGKVIPMNFLDGHAATVQRSFYDSSFSSSGRDDGMAFWGIINWNL